MALEGLKGLTAKDRKDWEIKYSNYLKDKTPDEIERMYRNEMFKAKFKGRKDYSALKQLSPEERDNFYNKYYEDSIQEQFTTSPIIKDINNKDFYTTEIDATYVEPKIDYTEFYRQQDEFKAQSAAYNLAMSKYKDEYVKGSAQKLNAIKDIKVLADNISPYYKKYKNTEYLPFTDEDWTNMAIEYNSRKNSYGDSEAKEWLQSYIQDVASNNQSILEKAWNGFVGMGASAAGALIGTFGMLKGAYDYATGNHKNIEGLNEFGNFIDAVMDNNITRYGNDVTQYGTITNLEEAKKSGLSELEVIQTSGQQKGTDNLFNQIFNVNTIPLAMQSGGFTVASMLTGLGEAQIANWAFKGMKGAAILGKTGNTTQKLMQARNILNAMQKAENFTNKFIIPGLTGTTEGVINGLGTKLEVLENAKREVIEAQSKYVDNRFNEIIESNPNIDPNIAYQQAWNEYESQYKEALEQAEFVASKAGINNFLVNSAINGLLNQTLKAGLQAPKVQSALQKSRVFNWINPKKQFNITDVGDNITVTPKYNFWKQTWNISKEPVGEFTEEYLQSISDAIMSGGAENNIHKFIENKYNGDGSAEIGDYMAGDFRAALVSMGESLIDNESIKSGIYGAISSAIGTPTFRSRDYTKKVKDNNGNYHTKIDLSRREGENRLEHISRLMPWRSGIFNSIRENSEIKKQLYDDAKTLEDWLKDPNNKSKFDGVVGTYNWAKQMESTARSNDEFGYRNSLLGKTINDVFMLEKMKGTSYYDSFMKELVTVANLENGTQQANDYIKSIKDNINTKDDNLSDEEILEQLKNNANNMLNTINIIQKESSKIDRLLGNVDEDTKQSLIFGQLSLQDWNLRSNKIKEELNNIISSISDKSKPSSNMSNELRNIISKYGSLNKAKKVKEDILNSLQNIKKDIENLNNRKNNLTDSEKIILKEKKVKLKSINNLLNTLKDIDNIDEEATILNEEEIMSLPIIDRAIMLNRENISNYSEKQKEIINNLIDKGTAKDINFYNKIQDAGRIELAKQSFLTQYNEILRDPNSFNMYVQRAKQAASDVLTKKRFEAINNISDYKKFALEMDKLMDNSSFREKNLILKALSKSNNANYNKYQNDRKVLEDLYNQIINNDTFKNIDANDADMFILSLQYLSNNSIDLNNESDVINTLSQLDENGNLLFQKYVEEINSNSSEETKVVFTSIGEVIQTYKDVIKNYKKEEKEKSNNSKPINIQPTTMEQSAPSKPINSLLGIFSTAATTLEEANESAKKTIEEQSLESSINSEFNNKEENELESSENISKKDSNNIIDEFKENSNEEVAKSVELGLKIIRNSSNTYSDKAKSIAENNLISFSSNEFENTEDLSESLIQKANQLDTLADENDENTIQASNLLRQVASKILHRSQEEKIKEKKEVKDSTNNKQFYLLDRARQQQETNKNIFDNKPNMNAGILDSSDIQWLKKNYPNNPIVKYWYNYNIEKYLQSNKLITGKNGTKVYFITDDILSQEVKDNMESNRANYTNLDIPIIAIVEDENGPLLIDNKKYQPIGTFPSTNNEHYKGVINVGKIRELVGNQESGKLIRDNNGNILTSTLLSVVAKAPEKIPIGHPNNNAQNLAFNTLNIEEQSTLKSIPKKDRYKHPIYIKMKNAFLEKLGFSEKDKYLYVNVSNLKDSIKDFRIFIRAISKTIDKNSDKLIVDLFNENKIEELLNSNSRIIKASSILDEISSKFPDNSKITLNRINGQLVPTGEFSDILDNISSILTRKMNNHLMLPNQNWKYVIVPTDEILENGRRIFSINISDNNTIIPVGKITNGTMSSKTKFEFFKNLIMDGTQIRKNGNFDFIKWQVEYPKKDNTIKSVIGNLANAFDDGILEMSNEGIEYKVRGIEVRSPFTSTGETIKSIEISNSNNATPFTPINTPSISANNQVQSGKAIIDSETGTILEGKIEEKNDSKLKIAKDIADKIIKDSKLIELDSNGNGYINTKTGKKYSSITSIIRTDTKIEEIFDSSNPWILPYTNIKASVNDFIEDFFAGEFYEEGKLVNDFYYDYPNATSVQWKYLAQELQKLKNSLDANGITIIPKNIIVTGSLNVTDSEDKLYTIDVAEKLNLLAYDKEGNFYIYNVKTVRDSIDQNKNKYTEQLSLYKKLLENTYGINIKSLNIIPIKVEYPEPKGWNNSTNEYTILEGNQLAINDKEYRSSKPQLLQSIEVQYIEPNIQYKNLNGIKKSQVSEIEKIIEGKDNSVNQTNIENNISTKKEIKVEEVTISESNESIVDLNTGLNIGKVKDRRKKKPGNKINPKPTRLIPSRLTWGVWENFINEKGNSLSNEETIKILESIGYTEEQWNKLSDQEMEHELNCKGIFISK